MRLSSRKRRIRGLAPLEMAMAVPVIVILFAVIFAMGRVGVMQISAVIGARHDAWSRRHGALSIDSLDLSSQGIAGTVGRFLDPSLDRYSVFAPEGWNPIGRPPSAYRGLNSGSRSWRFTVPPLLRPIEPKGSAEHCVLSHTWDHRSVALPGSSIPGAGLFPLPIPHRQTTCLVAPGLNLPEPVRRILGG